MGQGRVIDELIASFTHDVEMPALLPGVAPTGRKVVLPHVVVMGIVDGKVAYEHIYWDQGVAARASGPDRSGAATGHRRRAGAQAPRPHAAIERIDPPRRAAKALTVAIRQKVFEPVADLSYASATANRDAGRTMAFVRHTIDLNGCKLSFARGGTGVPLLYLHGTDGLAEWPAILDTLAQRFDVVAPDHPRSAHRGAARIDDVSDVAYLYLDAIETLGLSGIHVVDSRSAGGSRSRWRCARRSACAA